jgi:hypothetical protein
MTIAESLVGPLMLRCFFITLTAAAFWFGGCSRPSTPLTTLPSGKQIRITGEGPVHFSSGTDAMILNCETDISIDDMPNLRKEIEEIWSIFRKDVEKAGMTSGVIRVTHTEGSGLVTHSKGFGFVFEKRADGLWHCLQDEQK